MTEAAPVAAPVRLQEKTRRKVLPEAWFAWLLLAPAILFIGVIIAWPLVETVRLSFTDADLGGESYVGMANYAELLESRRFHQTIMTTFYWMFIAVTFKIILGLAGAVLLNAAVPGRGIFRMMVMSPWVIPIAIGVNGWLWLYNGYFVLLSGVGQRIGLFDGPYAFLAGRTSAFYSAREGQRLGLTVAPADCHVFDAGGRVLRRQAAPARVA